MKIIDLRSDTLTLPDRKMLERILTAPLGDAGRLDENERGGDPTVNALEDMAARMTGKERAIFVPSGTMGNHVALMTYCKPGDRVMVDRTQHVFRAEEAAFSKRWGQLEPVFYELTEEGYPDPDSVDRCLKQGDIALFCVENTHNSAGGTYIPRAVLERLCEQAHRAGVPIHMDGARLFNASLASEVLVNEICSYVDTVMFCISKGLGAPAGSLLCGNREFIGKASKVRKLLGGNMRQAGVLAAAGIYALEHNIQLLGEDHRRARIMAEELDGLEGIHVENPVQSNILILNVSGLGISAEHFVDCLEKRGVLTGKTGTETVRIVLYHGITDEDTAEAVRRIRCLEKEFEK